MAKGSKGRPVRASKLSEVFAHLSQFNGSKINNSKVALPTTAARKPAQVAKPPQKLLKKTPSKIFKKVDNKPIKQVTAGANKTIEQRLGKTIQERLGKTLIERLGKTMEERLGTKKTPKGVAKPAARSARAKKVKTYKE